MDPDDRFKPPAAPVDDPRPGKGSPVRGVVVGLLVDIGGTMAFEVVVSIVWGVVLALAGRSAADIQETLAHADTDPLLSTVLMAGGVLCSVLGGFVCERIARQGNYRLGVVLAALSITVGLVLGASASPAMWVLLVFLTFGSVLLGTRLGFRGTATRAG